MGVLANLGIVVATHGLAWLLRRRRDPVDPPEDHASSPRDPGQVDCWQGAHSWRSG